MARALGRLERACPNIGNNEVSANESLPRGTYCLPIVLLVRIDTGEASLKTGFGNTEWWDVYPIIVDANGALKIEQGINRKVHTSVEF